MVYEARNGQEALAFCETHEGPIDLLVSDVLMPELGGRELAEGALKPRPGMKVMFMSGHTQDFVFKEGVQNGTAFLQKPFTPVGLAQEVREILDSELGVPRRGINGANFCGRAAGYATHSGMLVHVGDNGRSV